ncbi:Translational regulator CsrA [Planctomycetales bacterium 10988]|nr:Translational regulator CsrA [Planctomycetales bacterium 10988]
MLVLTRKSQQKIHIGEDITITIVRVKGQAVRVGIEAPEHLHILRGELHEQLTEEPAVPVLSEDTTPVVEHAFA